jgi:signal transduction histidine kinase
VSDIHKLLPVFVLVLNLLLLGAALTANGRHHARNRAFATLAMALALWSLGVIGLRWSDSPTAALTWERVLHLGVIAIPVLFAEYARLMAGHARRSPWVTAGYAVAAVFVALLPTSWFMVGVVDTPWGYVPAPGPAYPAFMLYFGAYMLLGLLIVARAGRRTRSTFRRNRLRLVLIGVTVSAIGGAIDFARFLFDLGWIYPVGIPASGVFALAVGVAIVRYRLMNVGVAVKRGLLYALTWAAVAPALLVAVEVLDEVLPSFLGGHGNAGRRPIALTVLTALVLAMPIMRTLESLLGRAIFHRQRAIADALVALHRELATILDVPRLASTLTSGLVTRIPVAYATLYVPAADGESLTCLSRTTADEGEEAVDPVPRDVALWLRATRRILVVDEIACETSADGPGQAAVHALERQAAALVVPIAVDDDVAAILVIGEKLSGEVFDPAEIDLVEILGARAAIALKNARLYERLELQMHELQAIGDLYGRAREEGRAKEQFLAMLAHELRNPLAPIVNAVHVLQSVVADNRDAMAMVGAIRRQAEQLTRIVDDLLDISRVQLGKIRLTAEPVDMARLTAQGVAALRTSGKAHGRAVKTEVPSEPVVVIGDPVRLEQVLWNLLDNALKYSPPASAIEVSVSSHGDTAVLRVRDYGIGIAAGMRNSIFEIFTQADTGLQPAPGGLGLGLALVRRLVEQHHGTVVAHSDGPGRGSIFEVRLPLARDAVAVTAEAAPIARARTPRRVLVVEDSADARDALRAVLEVSGHEVRCTEDGPHALDVVRTWWPDVALVNIGLPGQSGYELVRELRGTAFGNELFIVAVTGFGQPDDRRRALDSGFDAHLVKPVTPQALLDLIATDRTER